jgi:hypothetical protein
LPSTACWPLKVRATNYGLVDSAELTNASAKTSSTIAPARAIHPPAGEVGSVSLTPAPTAIQPKAEMPISIGRTPTDQASEPTSPLCALAHRDVTARAA